MLNTIDRRQEFRKKTGKAGVPFYQEKVERVRHVGSEKKFKRGIENEGWSHQRAY